MNVIIFKAIFVTSLSLSHIVLKIDILSLEEYQNPYNCALHVVIYEPNRYMVYIHTNISILNLNSWIYIMHCCILCNIFLLLKTNRVWNSFRAELNATLPSPEYGRHFFSSWNVSYVLFYTPKIKYTNFIIIGSS